MDTRSVRGLMRRASLAPAVLCAATLLVGCTSTATPSQSAPSRQATTTGPSGPRPALDQRWYDDRNNNAIPDFIERDLGRDPDTGGCGVDQCPLPQGTSLPELLEGQNTLVVLDGSGSMAGPAADGVSKMAAAKQAIGAYVANTPRAVDRVGLQVYGHLGNNANSGKALSCRGTELIQPIGELDAGNVTGALARFRPTGWTPIAQALRTARDAFSGKEGELNRIILLSDGIETCGGDPVAAARELRAAGIGVRTDVVGFDVGGQADKQRLREIATAGGGEYSDATTAKGLGDYFDRLVDRRRALADTCLCLRNAYYDVLLCLRNLYNDATLRLRNLANEASRSGHEAQADEIRRIQGEVIAAGERQLRRGAAEGTANLEKVRRQVTEINRRLGNGGG